MVAANSPQRSLELPVADCGAATSGEKNDEVALADAVVCPPGVCRHKNEDDDDNDDELVIQAVCLSSLIAEEKYDVEGQLYITDSVVSDNGEIGVVGSPGIRCEVGSIVRPLVVHSRFD